MNDVAEFERQLAGLGLEFKRQGKHRVWQSPTGDNIVVPSTPSDGNWIHNAKAQVARTLGKSKREIFAPRTPHKRIRHARPLQTTPGPDNVPTVTVSPAPEIQIAPIVPVEHPWTKAELKKLKRLEHHEQQRKERWEKLLIRLKDIAAYTSKMFWERHAEGTNRWFPVTVYGFKTRCAATRISMLRS